MSQVYRLTFNLEVFRPEYREIIKAYLDGKILAHEASRKLGWHRTTWEKHMAGIFSVALGESGLAMIEEVPTA